MTSDPRLIYPAAERNKEPIGNAIHQFIDKTKKDSYFLEISSGSGQHIAYLAEQHPHVIFQPTEVSLDLFDSINGYGSRYDNVRPVQYLDARKPYGEWLDGAIAPNSVDYVLNVNMIHISHPKCTAGLFLGCGQILKPGQYLFTYGPYAFNGNISPLSNVQFNASLKLQRPEWGLKDVKLELEPLANENGLQLVCDYSLPANNHFLVWQKNK